MQRLARRQRITPPMQQARKLFRTLGVALLIQVALPAQQPAAKHKQPKINISNAQLAFVSKPEVTLIDSQAELDRFQERARKVPEGNPLRKFYEYLEPLDVDFKKHRLVAVCWGPHPFTDSARLHLESSHLSNDALRLRIRSSLHVGEPPRQSPMAPAIVYPALVMDVPRSNKVLVELFGARKANDDFLAQLSEHLVVTVAPDSMPLRRDVRRLPAQTSLIFDAAFEDAQPVIQIAAAVDPKRQVVDIAWCVFQSTFCSLSIETLEMRGDVLHVGVVAHHHDIAFYSGPGAERPRLRIEAPISKRVAVHVRRTGEATEQKKKEVDFEPFTKGKLTVTVDKSQVTKAGE
jgi:hypothetical protein